MKRALPVFFGISILGAVAATLVFVYKKSQVAPIVFETAIPTTQDVVRKTVATGSIVPRHEIEIKPRVSGLLARIDVEAGDLVKKGQNIAQIQIVPNVVNLNNAEAAVKQSRISFDNAKAEHERNQDLFAQQLISETELNRFTLAFQLRQQEYQTAINNVELIRTGASKQSGKVSNVVTATVEGTVLNVPVEVGSSVTETNNFNAGTTIAVVADMGDMIFRGYLDESEVGKVKEGMTLDINVGAIEEKRFTGKLEYIAPKGELVDGAIQFQIRASVELPKQSLVRANYSANADIVLDRRVKALTIEESVLQFDDDGTAFVELETGPQKFRRSDIKLGLSDGIHVEVLAGLDAKAKIKKPLSGKQ